MRAEFEGRRARLTADFRQLRRDLKTRAETEFGQCHEEYERLTRETNERFESARQALLAEEAKTRQQIEESYRRLSREAASTYKNQRWETQTAYLAQRTGQREITKEQESSLLEKSRRFQAQEERLVRLLESRRMGRPIRYADPITEPPVSDDPEQSLVRETEAFQSGIDALEKLSLPRLVGPQLSLIFLGTFLVLAGVGACFYPMATSILLAAVGGLIVGGILAILLYLLARRQVSRAMKPLTQAMARVVPLERQARANLSQLSKERRTHFRKEHRRELRLLRERFDARRKELLEERSRSNRHTDESFPRRLAEITQERDDSLRELQTKYIPILREKKALFTRESESLERQTDTTLGQTAQEFDREWNQWIQWCRAEHEAIARQWQEIQALSAQYFPDWESTDWGHREIPSARPPGLRIGSFRVNPIDIVPPKPTASSSSTAGNDEWETVSATPPAMDLPAALRFPDRISMLVETSGHGFVRAHEILTLAMLRLLTSIPPGKVRLTVIDPVGLGQEFAAFMHLADHDENLIGARIWTESAPIEQRMTDLTEHLENVIQKYLRNTYDSIEAYNADAGEIAEPYRILVVARFPVGFSDDAVRRLLSLISAGPKCGVYVLASVDTKAPLPAGFALSDLERHATVLKGAGDSFRWQESPWTQFPLRIDPPALPDTMNRILRIVGEGARQASRVEVPFRVVIPPESDWWTADSRREIRVPLGRAGATKLQYLSLGLGTSQHVLIAGKTGSGKSTLLHALITSAALRYAPDQLSLYLIDFKKGVEFKAYATHQLPHARVVAIESEREFGLSVMQRLDAELARRGNIFRDAGVQDVAGYRERADRDPSLGDMPRILLVVDEFQEFFVADDKIAQEAALLLDRLVRQGRAFGIHVLLGSQTLGGAYSLARSTLGQMAIRIALQCSESDAHLILSEDNTAARLLHRPGEAIYNDANGRIEGNNPFQIVWLPDHEREDYLRRIARKAHEAARPLPHAVVFEGNAPSSLEGNPLLLEFRESASRRRGRPTAWLGEPIEIKPPTGVEFPRQAGSNLLIVGQDLPSARGVMASALISLAWTTRDGSAPEGSFDRSADPKKNARFYLLDGSDTSAEEGNENRSLRLDEVAEQAGLAIQVIERRRLTDSLSEMAETLARRQMQEQAEPGDVFLLIFDLGRFRDLRRGEDDFGFSMSQDADAPAKPDQLLSTIVRDGPAVGIHVVVWVDSLANAQRSFDRNTLREFGSRVLFQMSANDSSQWIDSPQAGRLGPHRAYLHQEDLGRLEKFRPYAVPDSSWLSQLRPTDPSLPTDPTNG